MDRGIEMPTPKICSKVLKGRYKLQTERKKDSVSEIWTGRGEDEQNYLIKIWPFEGERPDDLKHALWDKELRILYRLGSSPGAPETLLVLRDAGVDRDNHCFVMVLEGAGYDTLAEELIQRQKKPLLATRDPKVRRNLWEALERIATGLTLLHDQRILHRNLGAENTFFDSTQGLDSLRLGGFEWSVRLGLPAGNAPPEGWHTPPEFFENPSLGFSLETDWYAYGMLATRLLLNLEATASISARKRHPRVIHALENANRRDFSEIEQNTLLQLIAPRPEDRLHRSYEVLSRIKDILIGFDSATTTQASQGNLVVVFIPSQQNVYEPAAEAGFQPDPVKPDEAYNPRNPIHISRLTSFLREDLAQEPQLHAQPNSKIFVLVGQRMQLLIKPFDPESDGTQTTWDLAFCSGTGELRGGDDGLQCTKLPRGGVDIRTVREIRQSPQIRQGSRSWEALLPRPQRGEKLRANLSKFHDFIRCTNQIEVLQRDAELFHYRIIKRIQHDDCKAFERIIIEEIVRDRLPVSFFSDRRWHGGISSTRTG